MRLTFTTTRGRRLSTTCFAVLLVSLAVLLPAAPAGAARFPSSAPLLGHSRLVTPAGRPATGAVVYLYPDIKLDHRFAVLQSVWDTTADTRGRFTLRAPYRGEVAHAGAQDDGWVNFMLLAVGEHRFAVWEFPARWSAGRWHVEPGTLPSSLTLRWAITPGGGHGHGLTRSF